MRQDAQRQLRETMAFYGGWRKHHGDDPAMTQRRFYLTFGTDVMTAQTLGAREALELGARIHAVVRKAIDGAVNKGHSTLHEHQSPLQHIPERPIDRHASVDVGPPGMPSVRVA